MLPDSGELNSAPLSSYDFSDLLTATITNVPRELIVKFNNSWLYYPKEGKEQGKDIYLVACRAIVYRYYLLGMPNGFAPNLPTVPGIAGTPWAHGWGCPYGKATEEATVPEDRHGRYFDGIGIAKVEIGKSSLKKGDLSVRVLSDQIIENTDGYEDPRIFWHKGKVMIHAHRFHPDITRATRSPKDYPLVDPVNAQAAEGGEDEIPGLGRIDITKQTEEQRVMDAILKRQELIHQEEIGRNPGNPLNDLCVKVAELVSGPTGYRLENEFFYGLNATQTFEKNYGFFEQKGLLNAIYGVAPYNKSTTFLREIGRKPCHVHVEKKEMICPGADCFVKLQTFLRHGMLNQTEVLFSTGSPLIPTKEDTWLGIGHVKFEHNFVISVMKAAYECFLNNVGWKQARSVTGEKLIQWCVSHFDVVCQYLEEAILKEYFANVSKKTLSSQKETVFRKILSFLKTGLAKIGADLICHRRPLRICGSRHKQFACVDSKIAIFLHPHCFYFNYLYEVRNTENGYRVERFSDAFLLTEPGDPCYLQFATGLATTPDGYLISYGENDHRACVAGMTAGKVRELLIHSTTNFRPESYDFHIEEVQKSVLEGVTQNADLGFMPLPVCD